jgi:hypothetical protein
VLYLFLAIDVAFIAFHVLAAAARHAGLVPDDLLIWLQLSPLSMTAAFPSSGITLRRCWLRLSCT